ncbi:MAG: aminotransferase class IV, partial [Balneolaceae bacterium]|nr:aminotransferase class IV [Balneolaceae bacterium]
MGNPSNFLMLNGDAVPSGQASISPEINGLYHGTGAFETFFSEDGSIFRFREHIERLHAGLSYLGFQKENVPEEASLRLNVDELLKLNGLQNNRARIRIQVSEAGTGGYSSNGNLQCITLITAEELSES